ncbi:hypothetical protein V8J88_01735 [Massilia sp. W12]|uniref:hypothetical protein n=1 Tax=Massilia sp. W12 TaxID=3126507 RepID=UPI0030D3EB30
MMQCRIARLQVRLESGGYLKILSRHSKKSCAWGLLRIPFISSRRKAKATNMVFSIIYMRNMAARALSCPVLAGGFAAGLKLYTNIVQHPGDAFSAVRMSGEVFHCGV